MRKYVVEFIGTFALCFTVINSVAAGAQLAPIGIGVVLAVMIYAGGHISGAHYNPAVSVAAWVRGKLSLIELISYSASQIVAGFAAAFLASAIGVSLTASLNSSTPAFIVETLFTFLLAFVVLNVATAKATAGNSYFGFAIGGTVLAGAVAVGGISGAVFNPAVATTLVVSGALPITAVATYIIAQILGGIVAGMAFKVLNPLD